MSRSPSFAPAPPAPDVPPEPTEAYEPPRVTVEEPYDPVGLTLSCADSEGNPPCGILFFQ